MFDGLLLNNTTINRLEAFIEQLGHVLLITGPYGAGKKYLARRISTELLGIEEEKLDNHPHFSVISKPKDKTEIPIESARQLIKNLSLKVPGASTTVKRVAVLEDAELLSIEAQNALLKLLEEPPAGTVVIMTSSFPQSILPTVVSRAQKIVVQPVTLAQSQAFYEDFSAAEIESAWRLSRGSVGLMSALLSQGKNHQMRQAVAEAKKFMALKKYERLNFIQPLTKDKTRFGLMLEALSLILNTLHRANISNPLLSAKLLEARSQVLSAQESFKKNTNLRLLALNLVLSMPV